MAEKRPILFTCKNINYHRGQKTITIHVKGKPIKAGIDPYNKLIDRIPVDNIGEVDID
jgi:hypothetical protein